MRLHGYFRSGAAFRVRIALNLKGIAAEHVSHHLRKGEQRAPEYLAINPQGLVPALETDEGHVLTQSVAIIDYLDAVRPEPRLIPAAPLKRARVMAFALAIACDVHPVQNLKVLKRVRALGHDEAQVNAWAREVNQEGLEACQAMLPPGVGPFCFGPAPTIADVFLVPQLFNARRFGADLARLPRLVEVEAACMALPAFAGAAPDRQPDFET
jgi:maleylpyruvate isomerase